MRWTYPNTRIFITKLDLDAAYQRLHVIAEMAVLTITILKKIAYILLRLPFGVANGPNDFSLLSEPIMDLTNDILRDDEWDPLEIHSPLQPEFDSMNEQYDNKTPFGTANKLFVPMPFHPAMADGYIDDIVTAMLDQADWVSRGQNAAPLAVHTVFRPVDDDDPLPRADAASKPKLKGEGTPDEAKTVLGWLINTRLFRIFLPIEKAADWTKDLRHILRANMIDAKTLESIIGRLNHAGYIIPQSRYFLTRLRDLLIRCKSRGPQKLTRAERDDIHLWINILNKVSTIGVDINNITFTSPSTTTYSDACETGLGGFNSKGLAWRFELPSHLWGLLSINLLEFIGAVITIESTLRNYKIAQRILSFTDSSSALGWLHKASFSRSQPVHDTVARYLATVLMDADSALYSQHIRGIHNFISDSLSRDHHLSIEKLTLAYRTLLPDQVPPNFVIMTLPPDIVSWIHSLGRSLTKPQVLPRHPTRSKLGALTDGYDSWEQWESKMSGVTNTLKNKGHTSCPHLRAVAEEISMVRQAKSYSPEELSSPPSRMYVRPFGRIFGQTRL